MLFCLSVYVALLAQKKRRTKKTNDVHDIIGTVLSLPSHPTWSIMEQDTIVTLTNNPKLIVYFKNSSCMPCALKELRHWNHIIEQISSFRNEGIFIELIFILQTCPQNRQVRNTIINQNFAYPIMYDEIGEFEEKNTLPENELMHAFFVNSDNKVLFVGNPILSSKHEKILNSLYVGFGKQ